MKEGIYGFKDEYRWLSNMWLCTVKVNYKTFPSSEHAFVYGKVKEDPDGVLYDELLKLSPRESKIWGRSVDMVENWEDRKLNVMYHAVYSKFNDNQNLKKKLLETGDLYLEESNYWNDTFWGVCDGVGQNKLGEILMKVRNELRWGRYE
jgi:ribA/ribD-fused uncharacterized protein